MSEGGRKVWNREQLRELNDGATFIRLDRDFGNAPYLCQQEKTQSYARKDEYLYTYLKFGDECETTEPRPDEYPLELVWEPTDGN